ncbi:hypothetical protein [Deinococcus sp. Arct2-2]|uniref:hypothetical protein n=1 Tax=Deinococcus sp. Arct2-2 TaxID=2568653 RepID=UPI001454DC2D|nr:hypothetical protein [Deinococcus sp. Arct2-2]
MPVKDFGPIRVILSRRTLKTGGSQQQLADTQELRIVVKRDASRNTQVQALIVDSESHATVAYGDTALCLEKAVMNLVEG